MLATTNYKALSTTDTLRTVLLRRGTLWTPTMVDPATKEAHAGTSEAVGLFMFVSANVEVAMAVRR